MKRSPSRRAAIACTSAPSLSLAKLMPRTTGKIFPSARTSSRVALSKDAYCSARITPGKTRTSKQKAGLEGSHSMTSSGFGTLCYTIVFSISPAA
jgi:hypothetical protein